MTPYALHGWIKSAPEHVINIIGSRARNQDQERGWKPHMKGYVRSDCVWIIADDSNASNLIPHML